MGVSLWTNGKGTTHFFLLSITATKIHVLVQITPEPGAEVVHSIPAETHSNRLSAVKLCCKQSPWRWQSIVSSWSAAVWRPITQGPSLFVVWRDDRAHVRREEQACCEWEMSSTSSPDNRALSTSLWSSPPGIAGRTHTHTHTHTFCTGQLNTQPSCFWCLLTVLNLSMY